MIVCGWDTETTGFRDPIHIVQLGAVLVDVDSGMELGHFDLIVKPDGYEIPEEATKIHGISTTTATRVGVPLVVAIAALTHLWSVADVRVAHNAEYDERVIAQAIARLGKPSALTRPPGVCTKLLATPILNLPPTEKMVQGRLQQAQAAVAR